MNDADRKAWLAAHNINTEIIDGQIMVDETAIRQIADHAPDPARAHAILDQMFAEADANP